MRSASWSQRLLSLLLLSVVIAIPLVWIVGGYMRVELTEMIGFQVSDGFCAVGTEPFGQHCFSDFAVIRDLLAATSFWDPASDTATAYPPSGWMIPVGIYVGAKAIGGAQFATYAFLLVLVLVVLSPAIWVSKGDWWRKGPLAFLVLGTAAAPVLVVLDRGNSTALVVLPLMIFAIGLYRENPTMVVGGLVASTLLKPQMILLVVALLALRRYRDVILAIGLSVLGFVLSFLLWPGDRLQNARDWLGNLFGYSDYGTLDVLYPYNLSVAKSALTVLDVTGMSALIGETNRGHVVNILTNNASLVGVFLLLLVLVVVVFRRGSIDILTAIFLSVTLVIIVPGTSFSYYLVLLVPVAALVLKDPRQHPGEDLHGDKWSGVLDAGQALPGPGMTTRAWIVIGVLVFSFSLWALPLPAGTRLGDLMGNTVGGVQVFWGPVLLLGTVAILISLAVSGKGLGGKVPQDESTS